MKKYILFAFITILFSCKEESQPVPGTFGQVTEFGTEKPIANARMELYKCNSDGFASACFLIDSVFTDSEGRYQITYDPEEANYHVLTPVAERYFAGAEKILNSGLNIEQDFVLDPFAWLNLRVVNEAPGGEFDRIDYTYQAWTITGSPRESCIGSDVNKNHFELTRGANKDVLLLWEVYDSGELAGEYSETIFIAAHDTLDYEIRY